MSYMTREDIPYHYALADAFTVGDAYHMLDHGADQPQSYVHVDGLRRQRELLGQPAAPTVMGAGPVDLQRPQRQQCVLGLETFPKCCRRPA